MIVRMFAASRTLGELNVASKAFCVAGVEGDEEVVEALHGGRD